MQHECKITVLDTKAFPELQMQYLADPKSGPCPYFKKGDTFLLKRTEEQDDFYHLMNGRFCGEAWDAISRYVYTCPPGRIYHAQVDQRRTHDDCLLQRRPCYLQNRASRYSKNTLDNMEIHRYTEHCSY